MTVDEEEEGKLIQVFLKTNFAVYSIKILLFILLQQSSVSSSFIRTRHKYYYYCSHGRRNCLNEIEGDFIQTK